MRPDEPELKALMVGALDGNQDAYRQLLRRLVPILRQYLARRVASGQEDVEDIMQETLLAIDTRLITYDRARPFTPWVYAIAHHKFVDLVRRARPTSPRSSGSGWRSDSSPAGSARCRSFVT